jgi:4'-phosphopantetheinyl transferase
MNDLPAPRFVRPPQSLALDAHVIHVWRIRLDGDVAQFRAARALVSEDERDRAARFHFDRDRFRHVFAHAALRQILARYRHAAPTALTFETTNFGKPFLKGGPEFNLTHSGELALLAVTNRKALGVDVEREQRATDYALLAQRFFSAPEIADLTALSAADQPRAFFTLWTRKEAFIKAIGEGLSFPLAAFDAGPRRGDGVRLINLDAGKSSAPQGAAAPSFVRGAWHVSSFIPAEGYIASLAASASERRAPQVKYWEYARD